MSDFDDDDLYDELPAALRKQLKAKDKALADLQRQYAEVAKRDRERTLGDALTEKGLPAKVAKFYPADAEISNEAVSAWLTEYEDIFSPSKSEPPAGKTDEPVAPPDLTGYSRVQNITQSASDSAESAALHAVNSAPTEADLIKMIMDAGGGA